MAEPQGYNFTADAVREMRRMYQWWKCQPRNVTGGQGPVFPPIPFQHRRFELKDSLTPGGSAEAYMLVWDGSSDYERHQVNGSYLTFTVYDTAGDKRARGKDDVASGEDGARGWCVHPHDVDRWEIGEIHQQAKRCSAALTADAGPGASATVDTVVPLDGGMNPVNDSTSATITSCAMPAAARALDNAPCVIEWDENGDAWKIVQVHEQARTIRGTLSGDMATTDASKTITSPVAMDGGQIKSGTVTGWNVFNWEGDSGGEIFAVWNETTDRYEFMQVECPSA